MKRKQTCGQVGDQVVRGKGCCLLVIRSVYNKVTCPADERKDKKCQTGTSQEEGKGKEPKPNTGVVDRNEVVGSR